ncbi:MAG: GNAT family N-acetyltransferase [Bacteroidetes bacterium]|nr:MAG: GNAT family N-acetyltransferase [Bacteroidota bacterium]
MNFQINAVEDKKGLLKFVKSQWNFYNNHDKWVPPLISERMKILDVNKNPFFTHSRIRLFLAKSGKEIVGRIAAIINENHNKTHNDKVGFFGFFECINEQEVADALFKEAAGWIKEQGMNIMRGPMNPSTNDDLGCLIKGYELPPTIMMPYNPEYYHLLIEKAGFEKAKDLFAYKLTIDTFVTDKMARLQNSLRQRYKVTIREVNFKNKAQFNKDVNTIKDIYNKAWEPNWGFVKMTDEEFDFMANDLKQVADPRLALIAESDGKIAGFALALPDINQSLIYNKKGRLLPALWHLITKKKKIDTVRIIVLGVLPDYQRTGIDSILYYEFLERGKNSYYKIGEAGWILEDNVMMNRGLTTTMNGENYKTYRIYDKRLN